MINSHVEIEAGIHSASMVDKNPVGQHYAKARGVISKRVVSKPQNPSFLNLKMPLTWQLRI